MLAQRMSPGTETLTIAGANAANAAVALQTEQTLLLSVCNEGPLPLSVATGNPEADVHSAARRLVWHNSVDICVLVKHAVDQVGLLIRDLFLASNALCSAGVTKILHDLPFDPYVEDGQGVVERIILGNRGVVENDRPDGQVKCSQKIWRSIWRLRRQKRLLQDGNGNTCVTNVLLGTTEDDAVLVGVDFARNKVGGHVSDNDRSILAFETLGE